MPEAYLLAQKEVLDILGQEERRRVHLEMDAEETRLDEKYENAQRQMIASCKRQVIMDKSRAVKVLVKAYRARKAHSRLREECRNIYEKLFDETLHAYYYRNLRSGATNWEKPKIWCQNTILCTWWKTYPTPSGPCINFATNRNNDDGRLYCDKWWELNFPCNSSK